MCNIGTSGNLGAALDLVDEANREDPNDHQGIPLAYYEGLRATNWLEQLQSDASDELTIAARAHHLRRWELARGDFAEGRAGYLRWRAANKQHQIDSVLPLMTQAQYSEDSQRRVGELLSRRKLATDSDVQALEDVACLVFLETKYEKMAARTEPDHLERIVAKTVAKMSPEAVELAGLSRSAV